MEDFIKFWDTLSPLDQSAKDGLLGIASEKIFIKGESLLTVGTICRHMYFVSEGLVKMSFLGDGREFVLRFFAEGTSLTGLDSFINSQASTYNITALENTKIIEANREDFERLCTNYHSLERAYRKFYAAISYNMLKRISEMLEDNAAERYANFLKDNKALLPRISLGDVAAYLGITQVSLSRIRAGQ